MTRRIVAPLLALVLMTGCTNGGPRPVTVLAASNVLDLVQQGAAQAGVEAAVSGAGTQQLVAQVRANGTEGLDLLLFADEASALALSSDIEGVPPPLPWVSTALVLVAPADRRDLVGQSLEALASDPALDWVLAQSDVPLGGATAAALADVPAPHVVSFESSALSVLAKAESGDVDLAVVYDANARPGVAAGRLVVVATFAQRVTTFQQPLTRRGSEVAALLRSDVDLLKELGFRPED